MEQRKEEIEKLFNVIEKINNQVLNLNGAWGAGKSYVADELIKKLQEDNKNIAIKIELGNYDYIQDSLIPIYHAIFEAVERLDILDGADKKDIRKKLKNAIPWVGGILNILHPGAGELLKILHEKLDKEPKKDSNKTNNNQVEQNLSNHNVYNKIIQDINNIINQLGCNFFIFIDDFERVNPEFAYRVLNIINQIKHQRKLNNENNGCRLLFCYVMNRLQYEKQLRHLFGNMSDENNHQEHYLTKFIDLEHTVLPPKIEELIVTFKDTTKKYINGDYSYYFTEWLENLQSTRHLLDINENFDKFESLYKDVIKDVTKGNNYDSLLATYDSLSVTCAFLLMLSIIFKFELNSIWYGLGNVDKIKESLLKQVGNLSKISNSGSMLTVAKNVQELNNFINKECFIKSELLTEQSKPYIDKPNIINVDFVRLKIILRFYQKLREEIY